ncbi:MAG: rod shape determining protein RodA [Bacteroidetes bacterium]|nr:MAG: rod shape determining protein RodA [Bacteroidota bacterium]
MRENKSIFTQIELPVVLLYLALTLIGWLSIYAAVYNEEHKSIFDISQRYGKQLLWIGLALVLGLFVMLTDTRFFNGFAFIIYLVTIGMLVAVLLFGSTIAGSKSWFQIGDFKLQPAEFAKFSTGLALAAFLNRLDTYISQTRTKIISIGIIVLPAILILMQYDTGSALVFSAFVLVLFREGLSPIPLILGLIAVVLFILTLYFSPLYVIIGIAVLLALSLFFTRRNIQVIMRLLAVFAVASLFVVSVGFVFDSVLEPHQRSRINVLLGLDEDLRGAGYNVHQSKIAIGSGGFAGKGFLQGTQTKFNFVPEQSTDFIFCTVGEEWGFLGTTVLIGLYMMLFMRLIRMAERQRSTFSRVYGYSVVSVLFFHFAINIAMTIGLAPVIGIPLPFVSYGGSSLWAFTIMLFAFLKLDANRLNVL